MLGRRTVRLAYLRIIIGLILTLAWAYACLVLLFIGVFLAPPVSGIVSVLFILTSLSAMVYVAVYKQVRYLMAAGRFSDAIIDEIVDDVLSHGQTTGEFARNHPYGQKERFTRDIELSESEKVNASLEVIRIVLTKGLMVAGEMSKLNPESKLLY